MCIWWRVTNCSSTPQKLLLDKPPQILLRDPILVIRGDCCRWITSGLLRPSTQCCSRSSINPLCHMIAPAVRIRICAAALDGGDFLILALLILPCRSLDLTFGARVLLHVDDLSTPLLQGVEDSFLRKSFRCKSLTEQAPRHELDIHGDVGNIIGIHGRFWCGIWHMTTRSPIRNINRRWWFIHRWLRWGLGLGQG